MMRWYLILCLLLANSALLVCDVGAAARAKPIRIGALTDAWGPTAGMVIKIGNPKSRIGLGR